MKKIFILIALLLTAVLLITACSADPDSGTSEPTETEATEAKSPEGIVIVYPAANTELSKASKTLATDIEKAFGVKLECASDAFYAPDSQRLEMLIGLTNRPETDTVKRKLIRIDNYVCQHVDNKLILAGKTNAKTLEAVKYYTAKFVTSDKASPDFFNVLSEPYVYSLNYTISLTSCAGTSLSDYTIVYPKDSVLGEYYTALDLRSHLYQYGGFDIPVTDDSSDPVGKEILIGQTNRDKTPAPEAGKFSVSVIDGDLCVSASDLFGYIGAAEYLTDTLFWKSRPDNTIEADFSYTGDADTAPARAGEYRVMFNNVWGLGDIGFCNRDEYAAAFYLAYRPDVICLNEYWDAMRNQHVLAETLVANGYVEVIPKAAAEPKNNHANPESNVVPVFYDPTALKVIDTLYIHLTWYKDTEKGSPDSGTTSADDSKGITVVVFEGLDESGNGNGERFIICNTHLTSNYHGREHGYQSRLLNVETCWDTLKPFIETYPDASVLLGCDYNAKIDSDECKKLLGYGFKDCHDTADTANDLASAHGYPTLHSQLGYFTGASYNKNATYKDSIDHIFEYGDTVDAKRFETLTNHYTALFSDHAPLLLDFDVIDKDR